MTLPSATASATPRTVTVWLVFQGALVNTSGDDVCTVPSVVSVLAIAIDTSAVGSLVRRTVKVAVARPSLVAFEIADTTTPAVSLSTLVALTLTTSDEPL
ncbi:MAG: hypothetical protein H0U61_11660 [Nocardioidaceae bacterium]|nr:hypothetical protein [Nocardioidaceae bacterium]